MLDAPFTLQTTVISGFSTAKRYRITIQLAANAAAPQSEIQLQPNGGTSGCSFYARTLTSAAAGNEPRVGRCGQAATGDPQAKILHIDVMPRYQGLVTFSMKSIRMGGEDANALIESEMATTVDFTTLSLYFSAGSRTGNVKVTEFSK